MFIELDADINVKTVQNIKSVHKYALAWFMVCMSTLLQLTKASIVLQVEFQHKHHRLNDSSSHVLTATSLSYGKAKNLTPTES